MSKGTMDSEWRYVTGYNDRAKAMLFASVARNNGVSARVIYRPGKARQYRVEARGDLRMLAPAWAAVRQVAR